jgi:hypothetical protein
LVAKTPCLTDWPRVATFDIVDAEIVQHMGDDLLVMKREIDAIGLRAIAQRGVEQIDTLAAHDDLPGIPSRGASPPNDFFIVVLASHSSPIDTVLRCWLV